MVLSGRGLYTGFGGFLAGAACVWLHGGRLRTQLAGTRWAAERDGLTSLPNRAGIRARYTTDRRAGRQNSLVLLDLNGFKQVNDAFGHHVGDQLLVEVARRLAEVCPIPEVSKLSRRIAVGVRRVGARGPAACPSSMSMSPLAASTW